MVFNGVLISAVADVSAEAWQRILCINERLSSHQLLDILCCVPLEQLGRFAMCLWNFLCLPLPDSYYTYYSSSDESDRPPLRYHFDSSSSSSSSSAVDLDDYYHPHSD